jgi:hypothetical protein
MITTSDGLRAYKWVKAIVKDEMLLALCRVKLSKNAPVPQPDKYSLYMVEEWNHSTIGLSNREIQTIICGMLDIGSKDYRFIEVERD